MKSRIFAAIAALVLVLGFGWWLWSYLNRDEPVQAEAPPEAEASANLVTLSAAKLQAAGIEVAPAEYRSMQPVHTVPGRHGEGARPHGATEVGQGAAQGTVAGDDGRIDMRAGAGRAQPGAVRDEILPAGNQLSPRSRRWIA